MIYQKKRLFNLGSFGGQGSTFLPIGAGVVKQNYLPQLPSSPSPVLLGLLHDIIC